MTNKRLEQKTKILDPHTFKHEQRNIFPTIQEQNIAKIIYNNNKSCAFRRNVTLASVQTECITFKLLLDAYEFDNCDSKTFEKSELLKANL